MYFTTTVQGNKTKRKRKNQQKCQVTKLVLKTDSFMKAGEGYFELCSRCTLTQAVVPIAGVLLTAVESPCMWVTN